MTTASERPERLYKYRPFSHLSLEMLVEDRLYFADPSTFNDPLDAKPRLEADVDAPALERILEQLMMQRVKAELSAAARIIHYKGPKTLDHIVRQSQLTFTQRLEHIAYNASNPELEFDDPLKALLGAEVESELLRCGSASKTDPHRYAGNRLT